MPRDQGPEWFTGELVSYLVNKSKDSPGRQKFVRNATRFRKWHRGEMFLGPVKDFDDEEVDDRNARARRNIIGETVDSLSSIFLKNNPMIRRMPYLPDQAHLSDGLDSLWISSWDDSQGPSVFQSVMEESQLSGIGTCKIFWDPRRSNRYYPGRIVMVFIPSAGVYVDPGTSNDHSGQDASYIIQHMKRYPEEIVAKYGDDGAKAIGWRGAVGKDPAYWAGIINLLEASAARDEPARGESSGFAPKRSRKKETSSEKIDLYETWMFPDLMYGAELSAGDKTPEKYRFGLVGASANNKVMRVRGNPFVSYKQVMMTDENGARSSRRVHIGHGRHPFVFLHWRPVADFEGNRKFYDVMSMVEWMIPLQFNVNALRTNLAIILRSLANPTVLYNEDALATPPSKMVWAPGQIFKVRANKHLDEAVKILQGAQMPNEVLQMIAGDMQGIREAGGVKPGVEGLFPAPGGGTSHTPAETIGTLQQAAFAPLWKYVKHVGKALVQSSILYDGLIQQNFKPGQYMGATRRGEEVYIAWTGDHVAAQFRRMVVAGATTPIYDLEREQRESGVLQMTLQAIQANDPRVVRATIIFLDNLVFPWTHQYIQLLQEELERIRAEMEGMRDLGMTAMQGGGQQLALPQQGAGQNQGLEQIAQELGVSPEELMVATGE